MTPFEEELERIRGRAYLKKHAPLTCVVLVLVVLISALAHPLDWRQVLGCVLAGVLVYVGHLLTERGHSGLDILIGLLALILCLWSMVMFGNRGVALIWVQGGGSFAAGIFGAYIFHSAVVDSTDN